MIQHVLEADNPLEVNSIIQAYRHAFDARVEQVNIAFEKVLVYLHNLEAKMEKISVDNKLGVRLVNLEPMSVVRFRAMSENPEGDALDKMNAWAGLNGIRLDSTTHHIFGFNNPDPVEGKQQYGYEVWVSVTPEAAVGDVQVDEFSGGLYAVMSVQGIDNIGRGWQRLVAWCGQSDYRVAEHQWLEEHLSLLNTSLEEFRLDLYLPVAERLAGEGGK